MAPLIRGRKPRESRSPNAGPRLRVLLAALLLSTLPLAARADFYRVSSTADNTNAVTLHSGTQADPHIAPSLRSAIIAANAHAGADTILLPAGTYTLTISGNNENAAATGDLDITDALTIMAVIGSTENT